MSNQKGLFFKTVRMPERYDWEGYRIRERTVKRPTLVTKILGAGLALSGIGALFADSAVDLLGDSATPTPKAEASEQIVGRYDRTFEAASPAGKFALQYLTVTDITVPGDDGGNGFLGWVSGSEPYTARFNDGCLSDTAYDIDGGQIEGMITGVFIQGKIEGSVPTAAANAYVDPVKPNVLIIASGHADSRDLRFNGVVEGSQLLPADTQTQSTLDTYGCSTGLQGEVGRDQYLDDSPWVQQ